MVYSTLKQLFPDLEPALLEEITTHGVIKSVPAGATILESGQNIRSSWLVLEGFVKLYREGEDGDEFFMYHLRPGEACALSLVCALNHRQSAVTARALTDTVLLLVPLDYMDQWMRKYKTWNHFVMGTFRTRYEELLETIDSIAFRNMDERLEFYLRRYQRNLHANVLEITHGEIARELNSSREVITRLLRKLADQGKIKLNRSSIELINL